MWWWSKWVGVILSRRSVLGKKRFWGWAAKLKRQAAEVHAVYEACGFGFTLQRQLAALGIHCYVVCPQKLDERNKRVKTDGLDAKALCLKLDRFVEGNRDALALVRVPAEKEEQLRAIHRQREQLVKARKQLEAQGRSLMVNHGIEPVQQWWKRRAFAQLQVPEWMRTLLLNSQPILKWRALLAKGTLASGAARKKAIVAVARQLAIDLWRFRTGRGTPEQLGLTI